MTSDTYRDFHPTPGVYRARELVALSSPLLDTIILRLGQDNDDQEPARDVPGQGGRGRPEQGVESRDLPGHRPQHQSAHRCARGLPEPAGQGPPLLDLPDSNYRFSPLHGAHPTEYWPNYQKVLENPDLIDPPRTSLPVTDPARRQIDTSILLIGNLARIERRLWFLEIDALMLILVYAGGLWLLYARGM